MTKYCTECGAQNTDDANFCNKCAHPFHQIKQTEIEETPKEEIEEVPKEEPEVEETPKEEIEEVPKEEPEVEETPKESTNTQENNIIQPPQETQHGQLTSISKCPMCRTNTLGHYYKGNKIINTHHYYCPNCGILFQKVGNNYELRNINASANPVWEKYHKKVLSKEEWIRICDGGISNKEQKQVDKANEKALKIQQKQEAEEHKKHINALAAKTQQLLPTHPELLKPIQPQSLILKKGETAYIELPNITLMEPRAVRTSTGGYGGGSVRVAKGVSIRMGGAQGRSTSHDELTNIDTGTLTISNKRIVYSGSTKNYDIPLTKVVNLTPFRDALEVQVSNKQKPEYFKGTEKYTKSFNVDGENVNVILNSSFLKAIIISLIQN